MPCVYVSMVCRQEPPSLSRLVFSVPYGLRPVDLGSSTVVKNISPFGLSFLCLHLLFICKFLTSLGRLLSVCLQVLDF